MIYNNILRNERIYTKFAIPETMHRNNNPSSKQDRVLFTCMTLITDLFILVQSQPHYTEYQNFDIQPCQCNVSAMSVPCQCNEELYFFLFVCGVLLISNKILLIAIYHTCSHITSITHSLH